MAIFGFRNTGQVRQLVTSKVLNIILHSFMLILCLIGSIIFLQQMLLPTDVLGPFSFMDIWQLSSIKSCISASINFLKIKVLIPVFILTYFYYCIRQKVFHKLIKGQYVEKYDQKYKQIHRMETKQINKKQDSTISISLFSQTQKNLIETQHQLHDRSLQSSLNMSMSMVKSMSRSMLGSFRSAGPNLGNSMIQKGNLTNKSSKVVQNISKKNIQSCRGKDLGTLFDKGKNVSDSFISASSSGIQGDQAKIKIKNKKYYESVGQKQGKQYQKWFQEANKKYAETIKNERLQNIYYPLISKLKKSLQIELSIFLKEYHQNKQALRQCLTKFWSLKIQGFQTRKPFKSALELSSLFREQSGKDLILAAGNSSVNDSVINEKVIFQKCLSVNEFISRLNRLKVPLRYKVDKSVAQRQVVTILSKRIYLNTLLNISSIQDQLFSELQLRKIRNIQISLNLLTANKIGFFSLAKGQNQVVQMDLLEQYQIQRIKEMVQARMTMLTFVVNKMNLMSTQRNFKVKMNEAVTFDSGFLSTTMNFFNNKNFAQIICEKGYDNAIPHFNLKVYRNDAGNVQNNKQRVFVGKPGIDNSISIIFLLAKSASEYLGQNHLFQERLTYQNTKKDQLFRQFVESLYPNLKI